MNMKIDFHGQIELMKQSTNDNIVPLFQPIIDCNY